ncbi:hypothetical protein [Mycobacterium paragordonae]|uniref:hypothetical protein n=1 Tax=Mycobacterium paragordonae TaxID=1389713 RepID=UPI00105FFD4A|nr:hypothetical protein [Mycobacterium paragordonae]TDL05454.1 hypothetical protein EUA05_17925 [Mycobacterium paragordonae]
MAAGTPRSGGSTPPIEAPEGAAPAVSEDDKAKAAEAQAAKQAESGDKDARFVQYVIPLRAAQQVVSRPSGFQGDGSPASRVGVASAETSITPQQWNAVGIPASEPLVWNFDNNWRIPVSKLSDLQLNYLLTEDRRYNGVRFELVDGAGNKVDK